MFNQCPMSGEAYWQQMLELESRKEVIERWLSSAIIPSQLVEVMEEMLTTTERQLEVLRKQDPANPGSAALRDGG
jgi:hypothetical protein